MLTADISYITNSLPITFIIRRRRPGRFAKKNKIVNRIYYTNPGTGERFFLYILLIIISSPTSYKYLRTVNGVLYGIFKEAYLTRELITDDNE